MTLGEAYEILGLEVGASPQEVQAAYRELVQILHPDRFPDNERLRRRAEEQLKRVNHAHDLIEQEQQESMQGSTKTANAPAESDGKRHSGPEAGAEARAEERAVHAAIAQVERYVAELTRSRNVGLAWAAGGLAITVATVSARSGGVVFWGATLYGIWRAVRAQSALSEANRERRRLQDIAARLGERVSAEPHEHESPNSSERGEAVAESESSVRWLVGLIVGLLILIVVVIASTPPTTPPAVTPVANQSISLPEPVSSETSESEPKPTARTPVLSDFWTVVTTSLPKSKKDSADAQSRADKLAAKGYDALVINSDDYKSMHGGYWVSAIGEVATAKEAKALLQRAKGDIPSDAYVSHVRVTVPVDELIPAGFFTLGSSKERVRKVQGAPDGVSGDTWEYGYSMVYFDYDDKVRGWATIDTDLKVAFPTRQKSGATFTEGSSQEDVLRAQGTPDGVSGDTWDYGYSMVYFDAAGLVRGWSEIDQQLRVK